MSGGDRHVSGCPGDAVGGAARHLTDLVALQHHQGWLAVDRGGAIPLLSVVIVTPGEHLQKQSVVFGVTQSMVLKLTNIIYLTFYNKM